MSQNNMELGVWGDGTIRLAFWDDASGDDKIYELNADGTATMGVDDAGGVEVDNLPVDLVKALRELAQEWNKDGE